MKSQKVEFAPSDVPFEHSETYQMLCELDERIAAEAIRRGEINPFTGIVESFHAFMEMNS